MSQPDRTSRNMEILEKICEDEELLEENGEEPGEDTSHGRA